MEDSIKQNSRGGKSSAWSVRIAITGIVLIVIGLIGGQSGISPLLAMLMITLGSLALIIAGICGVIGLLLSKGQGSGTPAGMIWLAVVLGSAALLNAFLTMGGGAAPIHDISTDTVNPPEFIAVARLRGPDDNPAEYSGPETAALQAAAYPEIETIVLLDPRSFVFETALGVATDMGWEIVANDIEAGRIEATATTPFVGFKDDVVIRIQAKSAETHVDVRSKSRFGKGDMGANAKRILEFKERLIAAAEP